MKIDSYVENLIKLGLKEPEAKVYLNLLKKKNFTATEISRLSGVPRTKIYDVLHQLINKGLCVEILGGVKKYSPANPKIAFNGLIQRYEQDYQKELELRKIIVSNISDTIFPFYHSEKENTDPLDYIQVIREKNSIIKKFESLEQMSTQEVVCFIKGPFAMDTSHSYNLEEFNSLRKGVKYKVIYDIKDLRNNILVESTEEFVNAGEEVKIADKLPIPFKMYIFDQKTVMFTLEDKITSKSELTALIIEHPDLAKGLKLIFDLYWQNSMTWEEFKMKEIKEMK